MRYAAMLGAVTPTNGDSTISQTFTAPNTATSVSFWYKMTCPDTVTFDWVTASLYDNTAGTNTVMLANTCTTNSWTSVTTSVTAGHNYTLTLTSHDDNYGSDPTYTLFDDVAINASASMRLIRVSKGMVAENVGEWPRSDSMTNFELTTGANDSVVVSCWSSTNYIVGELTRDPFDFLHQLTQFQGESPAPGATIPPNNMHLRGLYSGSPGLQIGAYRALRGMSLFRQGQPGPELLPFGTSPNPADLTFGNLSQCF